MLESRRTDSCPVAAGRLGGPGSSNTLFPILIQPSDLPPLVIKHVSPTAEPSPQGAGLLHSPDTGQLTKVEEDTADSWIAAHKFYGLKIQITRDRSSLVAHQVEDLAWPLLWLQSLQWHRFESWPRNVRMPQAQPQKRTKKQKAGDKLPASNPLGNKQQTHRKSALGDPLLLCPFNFCSFGSFFVSLPRFLFCLLQRHRLQSYPVRMTDLYVTTATRQRSTLW